MEAKNCPIICCICNAKFQHPKILSCLHSFCFACLQNLQSNIKLEKRIQCPICHQKSELTKLGLDGLKTNFFLSRLVDESILLQTLFKSTNASCGLCSFETAESRCFDCAKFLCKDCQKIHNGIPSTFGHEILSLEESHKVVHRDLDKSAPARLKAWTTWNKTFECPNHPGEKSRFFCQTCEDLICTDCMVLDHPASSHSYTSLNEVAPGKRESAKNKMAQLKMKLPEADNLLQALKMMSSVLKKGTDRAKKDVKAQAQLNRKRVDEEEQRLLKETRLESQKQMRQLKEAEVEVRTMLRHIHNSLQSGSYFVEESTDSEFLWLYLILMNDLEHLEQLQIPRRPSTLSFISTEIDISLGELQKIDTAEMIIEEENTKSGKIGMSSSSSSSEISQPHAWKHAKETDVLEKPVPELKQQISDSSSVGPDSDAKHIMSSTQPSKTSTLPKPISQPTGKQTDKISSQQPSNSSGPKSSASAEPVKKVDKTSLLSEPLTQPTGKQTDKTSSQQSSNSSGPKSSASAEPMRKVDKTSLLSEPLTQPTGKQTDKTSSQQSSNSSGPKSSASAEPVRKVDKTSLLSEPLTQPTGKQTDKTSSQQSSNSSGPKSSASAEPVRKVDKTSLLSEPLTQPTGKQTDKTFSQQSSNSSGPKSSASAEPVRKVDKTSLLSEPLTQPTGKQTDKTSSHQSSNSSGPKSSASARPARKVDTTSLPIKTLTQPTDKTSSQQTNNSSAPKPSSSGARVSASDRVLRSSTKLNPINEGKVEIERQALQTRTNQPHLQSSSGKATADKISNEQRDKSAFQPNDFSVKSGKNKQKSVEKKDPADPRMMKGVQGGSMEESQRQDETDSALHKENGLQKLPAHLDSTSKSNHRWFSDDDCDSDDSDL